MLVSAIEGHRLWSSTYDSEPNPLVALNGRILTQQLGDLAGLRVVDIGCGTGRWIQQARAQNANCIGFDSCFEMLLQADRKGLVRGRVATADAALLPVRNAVADVIVCSLCLSYVRDPSPVLQEMSRITRLGGRIVISDLHPDAVSAGWSRAFRVGTDTYELAHNTHSADLIQECARKARLVPSWQASARFGTPERRIFQAAGRLEAFEKVSRIGALQLTAWRKP